MEKLPNLIKSQQFSRQLLEYLFTLADQMRRSPEKFSESLKHKILAAVFYEPSTRTRLSFESAMHKLGGQVIGTENAGEFSSAIKGESLEDSMRIIEAYADVIVLRHKEEGTAQRAEAVLKKPIINAGDGSGQHPSQSLLDMYTLWREFGHIDGLKIAMVGDLAHGRTVRSLAYLCAKFNNLHITFISPPNLKIGDDIKQHLTEHNVSHTEETDLSTILPKVDVVYMTRIQKERMKREDYDAAKGKYEINQDNLKLLKPRARIMHPLPHVEEIQLPIHTEQDDPRVAYFRQAENGLYARMALLHHLLT